MGSEQIEVLRGRRRDEYHPYVSKTEDLAVSDEPESPWKSWRDDVPPIKGTLGLVSLLLLGAEAVFALWLRFSAPQQLWLDESLTVSIAKLPFSAMHQALREDGAPPLYYVILHLWMGLFGTSNVAVRSLSGLFSVATVFILFVVVRRVWGREVALLSSALLLGSSFSIYYATETRMYSMVMFLCALSAFFLVRLFEVPSWKRVWPFALCIVALEYTHYWSLYLFVVLGLLLVGCAWRGQQRVRRAGRFGIAAFVIAGLAFLPWLPTFEFQSKHTGTPWGFAPHLPTFVVAIFHFNHNQMRQVPLSGMAQRIAEVLMVVLLFLALFAVAKGRSISLRWRTVPRARVVAWMSFGTLELGLLASALSGSAYAPRYGSVAYLALIVFLALGTQALGLPVLRVVLIGALSVCTLAVAVQQRSTPRTQAPEVVSVLKSQAPAGSVVVYCPDQLGPSTERLLGSSDLITVGYPRFDNPNFVNWVDYNDALAASNPVEGTKRLIALAHGKPIWFVGAPGYMEAGTTCLALRDQLNATLPHKVWVKELSSVYFQSMTLVEYTTTP